LIEKVILLFSEQQTGETCREFYREFYLHQQISYE